MFWERSRRRSPSTSRASTASRSFTTSSSVRSLTYVLGSTPASATTLPAVDRPIPCTYVRPTSMRLLSGTFTPAMRAKSMTSTSLSCRRRVHVTSSCCRLRLRLHATSTASPLPLLVAGVRADDQDDTAPPDYPATLAHRLYGRSYLHPLLAGRIQSVTENACRPHESVPQAPKDGPVADRE